MFSVAENFGVGTYAIFLFALTIWWSMNWGDATACPYTHLEEVIEGTFIYFYTDSRNLLLHFDFGYLKKHSLVLLFSIRSNNDLSLSYCLI